jgi:serine/threonine-protein kinase
MVIALKILAPKRMMKIENVKRFRREATTGLGLDHPNIVRTIDVGEDGGYHFIAMELVEGGNVEEILDREEQIEEHHALKIALQMAGALQAAADKGVVHRDIKPSNIMFDRSGRAKLSDFGLVKFSRPDNTRLTRNNVTVGTPQYISPEQARGDTDTDIRADIYSLGATLYHMVTGRPPFDDPSPVVIMSKHLKEDPLPPHMANPNLSPSCSMIIQKMMAKSPQERYLSPRDLAEDLEAVLAGKKPEHALRAFPKIGTAVSGQGLPRSRGGNHAHHRERGGRPHRGRFGRPVSKRGKSEEGMGIVWVILGLGFLILGILFALKFLSPDAKRSSFQNISPPAPASPNKAPQTPKKKP